MSMPLESLWSRMSTAVGGLSRWRGFAHVETGFNPRGHLSFGRRSVAGEKDIVLYVELQRDTDGWGLNADLSRGDGEILAEAAWRLPAPRQQELEKSANGEPVLALSTGAHFGAQDRDGFGAEHV